MILYITGLKSGDARKTSIHPDISTSNHGLQSMDTVLEKYVYILIPLTTMDFSPWIKK
jgi:hypothetical protein